MTEAEARAEARTEHVGRLTDSELQIRTAELLKAAQQISLELGMQTERLAQTIDVFNREVVLPLRSIHEEGDELRG